MRVFVFMLVLTAPAAMTAAAELGGEAIQRARKRYNSVSLKTVHCRVQPEAQGSTNQYTQCTLRKTSFLGGNTVIRLLLLPLPHASARQHREQTTGKDSLGVDIETLPL